MSNNPAFNLINEPWLPILYTNGAVAEVSLGQILAQAHEIEQLIIPSPFEAAAIYRLLLAIVHRVHRPSNAAAGPENYSQWGNLWQQGHFNQSLLDSYWTKWHGRFDLFATDLPFYQRPITGVEPKSIANLVNHYASGGNPTLFNHNFDAADVWLTPSVAAKVLIAAQPFAMAGGGGLAPKDSWDSVILRGVVYIITGRNLFETLMLNLMRYDDESPMPNMPNDCPTWELDNPTQPRTAPNGYIDYLTWFYRSFQLIPELHHGQWMVRQFLAQPKGGLKPAGLPEDFRDPLQNYRVDEQKGYLVQRLNEDGRALWRDFHTLFVRLDQKTRTPATLNWLEVLRDENYLPANYPTAITAFGAASNQAKVSYYREERLPLPLDYLSDDDLVATLTDARTMAEDIAFKVLRYALRVLATYIFQPDANASKPDPKDISNFITHTGAMDAFWAELALPFEELLVNLPHNPTEALLQWQTELRNAAGLSFQTAANLQPRDARTLKAIVNGESVLAAGLRKNLKLLYPDNPKPEVTHS